MLRRLLLPSRRRAPGQPLLLQRPTPKRRLRRPLVELKSRLAPALAPRVGWPTSCHPRRDRRCPELAPQPQVWVPASLQKLRCALLPAKAKLSSGSMPAASQARPRPCLQCRSLHHKLRRCWAELRELLAPLGGAAAGRLRIGGPEMQEAQPLGPWPAPTRRLTCLRRSERWLAGHLIEATSPAKPLMALVRGLAENRTSPHEAEMWKGRSGCLLLGDWAWPARVPELAVAARSRPPVLQGVPSCAAWQPRRPWAGAHPIPMHSAWVDLRGPGQKVPASGCLANAP